MLLVCQHQRVSEATRGWKLLYRRWAWTRAWSRTWCKRWLWWLSNC